MAGWYENGWYERNLEEEKLDCTVDQMREAAQNHLTTEAIMWNKDNTKTISGMVGIYHVEQGQHQDHFWHGWYLKTTPRPFLAWLVIKKINKKNKKSRIYLTKTIPRLFLAWLVFKDKTKTISVMVGICLNCISYFVLIMRLSNFLCKQICLNKWMFKRVKYEHFQIDLSEPE